MQSSYQNATWRQPETATNTINYPHFSNLKFFKFNQKQWKGPCMKARNIFFSHNLWSVIANLNKELH